MILFSSHIHRWRIFHATWAAGLDSSLSNLPQRARLHLYKLREAGLITPGDGPYGYVPVPGMAVSSTGQVYKLSIPPENNTTQATPLRRRSILSQIEELLLDTYPDKVIPHGDLSRIARDLGVAPQHCTLARVRTGMTVAKRGKACVTPSS